ncbi:hypothetical protein KP509_15G072800 [Ceratopteris richardii]|uniref:AAA+ ATPase domain-containing protein n=1 Tax=Ceratopteris richardii TaxID=49495 RepID=A0A8T2T9N1_CERRI|nr:hypothetical protein KP509_15G072800 [Ceratopteris richardii]
MMSRFRTSPLGVFCTKLTELARDGKLDPVVGRDAQTERVIQILGKRNQMNPCLVGKPGVGKTAVVERLAQRIIRHDVPETMRRKEVMSLRLDVPVAGTEQMGDLKRSLAALIKEINSRDDIILFIDEVHTLIRRPKAASNILNLALARGELPCIGATTFAGYRKHVMEHWALEKRFQIVHVPELTVEETILMFKGLKFRYEKHHQVHYTDDSLIAAARLSMYITDRFLPDKAISVMDAAGTSVRLRHLQQSNEVGELDHELEGTVRRNDTSENLTLETPVALLEENERFPEECKVRKHLDLPEVTVTDIQRVVSERTGIPVETSNMLSPPEKLRVRVHEED